MTRRPGSSDAADGPSPISRVGGLAVALARQRGLAPDLVVDAELLVDPVEVPGDIDLGLDGLGRLHEQAVPADRRRRGGVHYTPATVAAGLVDVALRGADVGSVRRVWDPAAGGGAFLLAAARRLAAAGLAPAEVLVRLRATDVDPTAVAVCRSVLALWAGTPCPPHVARVADPLVESGIETEVDLVVGNPPFLSPLAVATTPEPERRERLRRRFGPLFGPYVDAATLFLMAGWEALTGHGRLAMIQPLSFLAARDTTPARERLAHEGHLRHLWVAGEPVFGAQVDVCAPVYHRSGRPGRVGLHRGRSVTPAGWAAASTAPAAAGAGLVGVPSVPSPPSAATLGDIATVTAGFRDEFYAVADCTVDRGSGPAVVTTGRIDPLRLDRRDRPVRIRGHDFVDPRVDLLALDRADARVGEWVRRLLVPKVLVATQTPVIEVVADPKGSLVPLTPVVAVVVPVELVWPVAALLSAPTTCARAARLTFGTARQARVMKLAAREIRALPGLDDPGRWADAARAAQRVQEGPATDWEPALVAAAVAAERALGVRTDDAVRWWAGRLGIPADHSGLHPSR